MSHHEVKGATNFFYRLSSNINKMNQKKPITSLNSIEKCLQILSTFSLDQSQFSIKDICKKYQFNNSSVYRILCHLEEFGYVSRLKNKEYMVGTQAIYLNAIYTHSNHLEQLRPIIDKIRDISAHTASFFIEEGIIVITLSSNLIIFVFRVLIASLNNSNKLFISSEVD